MPFTGYWSNGPGVYVCDQPHCSARTVTAFRCWWKQELRAVGGSCSNAGAIWCPRCLGVKKGNEVYTHWIMDHVVTGPLVTPTTAAPTVTQTSPDGDQTDSDAAPTVTQTTAAPTVLQTIAAPDQRLDQGPSTPPPPPPRAKPRGPPQGPPPGFSPRPGPTTAAPTATQTIAAPTVAQTSPEGDQTDGGAAPTVTQTIAAPTETQTSPDGDQTDGDETPTVTQTTAAPAVTQSTAAPDQPLDQVPPPPPPKASEVPAEIRSAAVPPQRTALTGSVFDILNDLKSLQNEILSILEAQAERLGRIESRLDRMNLDPFGFTERK
jgi:hypothetical protein